MHRLYHAITAIGRCLFCGNHLENALCPRCDKDLTE